MANKVKVSAVLFAICCATSYSTVSVAYWFANTSSSYTMLLSDQRYKLVMMKPSCEVAGKKEIILSKQEYKSRKTKILYHTSTLCNGRAGRHTTTRYRNKFKLTYNIMRPVIKNPVKNAKGIPYPASGLYKNDESTTPLWTSKAIEKRDIYLSRDGNYMAVVANLIRGSLSYPAIVFYYKGKPFKEYYHQELMSDPGKMTIVHDLGTFWLLKNTFEESNNRLSIVTNSNDRLEFDITTGQLLKGPPTHALAIHGQVHTGGNKSVSVKNIHICHGFMEEPFLAKQPIVEPMLSGYVVISTLGKNQSLNKVVRIPLKAVKRIENSNFGSEGDPVLSILARHSDKSFQIRIPSNSELCATGENREQVKFKFTNISLIDSVNPLTEAIKPVANKYYRSSDQKLLKVFFNNKLKGWAIAMIWGVPSILITKDGGTNWAVQYANSDGDFFPLDITFDKSGRYGWVFGTNQTLLTTSDYGLTWKKLTNFSAKAMLYIRHILLATQTYMDALEFGKGENLVRINYRENNYIPPSDKWLRGHTYDQLIFSDDNHMWVVHNGHELLKSATGDIGWVPVDLPEMTFIRQIHFIDRIHGWVLGRTRDLYNVILTTNDGGENWRTVRFRGN